MTDRRDEEQAKEKEKKMKKKEKDELNDAVNSLDDEHEKRPGTDDDGTEKDET